MTHKDPREGGRAGAVRVAGTGSRMPATALLVVHISVPFVACEKRLVGHNTLTLTAYIFVSALGMFQVSSLFIS